MHEEANKGRHDPSRPRREIVLRKHRLRVVFVSVEDDELSAHRQYESNRDQFGIMQMVDSCLTFERLAQNYYADPQYPGQSANGSRYTNYLYTVDHLVTFVRRD